MSNRQAVVPNSGKPGLKAQLQNAFKWTCHKACYGFELLRAWIKQIPSFACYLGVLLIAGLERILPFARYFAVLLVAAMGCYAFRTLRFDFIALSPLMELSKSQSQTLSFNAMVVWLTAIRAMALIAVFSITLYVIARIIADD